MKNVLLLASTAALALCAAQLASANASYTDPTGDAQSAPDITAVTAAHDTAGNISLTVRTSHAALGDGSVVAISFDTDQNSNTGSDGVEYLFLMTSGGWVLERWDGTNFVPAGASSANAVYANGLATFKVNKADLGGVTKFTFWADAVQFDANRNVVGSDTAPDGTAAYTYELTKPLTLNAGAVAAIPAKPAAGKPFTVRTKVTRGDTGGPLTTGSVTCTVRVGTAPLRATGKVAAGVASCAMNLPKTAKGKTVKVTLKVNLQGVSTTKTFSAKVV